MFVNNPSSMPLYKSLMKLIRLLMPQKKDKVESETRESVVKIRGTRKGNRGFMKKYCHTFMKMS